MVALPKGGGVWVWAQNCLQLKPDVPSEAAWRGAECATRLHFLMHPLVTQSFWAPFLHALP